MNKVYFHKIQCTLYSLEYIKIRSWLFKNEPTNPTISEINASVEHAYSPRPYLFPFSNQANEDIARVFWIIKKEQDKQKIKQRCKK